MHVIFNNGQFELDCIGLTYGYGPVPASSGGYVMRAPELFLSLEFEGGIPKILYRVSKTGYMIEHIEIPPDEHYPTGLSFLYNIITRMEINDGKCKVFMSTLRMGGAYKTIYGEIKEKHCIDCGGNIHYNYVVSGMSACGLNPRTTYNLWNNELIDFYCCTCYKKRELYKKEKEGELCLIQ